VLVRLRVVFCSLVLVVSNSFALEQTPAVAVEIRGMNLSDGDPVGARVIGVIPGSPAAHAGILADDVITEVESKPVGDADECSRAIFWGAAAKGNNSVILTIERERRLMSVTLSPPMAYDYDFEPPPPVPFPPAYQDYQILPGTISPNNRCAFIYPKRTRLYDLKKCDLFFASIEPFRILSRLPLGTSNLAGNVRCYYAATWSKDASTAVFIAGSRWGPEKVSVLQLHRGHVAQQTELTAVVRKQVLADFRKSHAERYNDHYNFVFDSEDRQTAIDGDTIAERGWDLDDAGHVIIDCTCTTDPKLLDPHRWAVRFKGLWDIHSGRFLQREFARIPRRQSDLP